MAFTRKKYIEVCTSFNVQIPLCGNFITFLSLRIYVKSVLRGFTCAKSAISTHLKALNFDFYQFLHFLEAEMYQIDKLQSA